jgi:hypothetical protein
MSGIETADMNPHTLDQGQLRLTTDSKSVEDLPSLPSHLALQVSASHYSRSTLRAPRAQYNANRIHRTSALAYDLNRARFVRPETEKNWKTGYDTHTTATKLVLLPRANLT